MKPTLKQMDSLVAKIRRAEAHKRDARAKYESKRRAQRLLDLASRAPLRKRWRENRWRSCKRLRASGSIVYGIGVKS